MLTVDTRITDLLRLIRAEYLEIPGLSLTKSQMQRLWGLDGATSDRLLSILVEGQFLRRNTRDAYVRADIN